MNFLNMHEIARIVFERKQRGISITKTLKEKVISKTSFYRWMDEHGITKWQDLDPENRVHARHVKVSQDFCAKKEQEDQTYTYRIDTETGICTNQEDGSEFSVKTQQTFL